MTDLDVGRRKARRYMAWLSFGALLLIGTSVLNGVTWGGELFSQNLQAAAPIINSLMWALTAIVGAYLGVSVTEAIQKGKGE